MAQPARAERVVVVLRRDEHRAGRRRGERAVDVGVDQVRVDDVRPDARGADGSGARAADRRRAGTAGARTGRRARRGRRRTAPGAALVSSRPRKRASIPRSRSAGSSSSTCRSEPPIPPIRWMWSDFTPDGGSGAPRRAGVPGRDERRGGEDREQEVERRAVAHGAGEGHRGERVVARAAGRRARGTFAARGTRRRSRGRTPRACRRGSTTSRPSSASRPRPSSSESTEKVGLQSMRTACAAEPRLLARLVAPEVEDELAVVALLRALVDLGRRAGEREVGGELGPGRRRRAARARRRSSRRRRGSRASFSLFAFQSARVSVVSDEAADLRLVPRHPRRDDDDAPRRARLRPRAAPPCEAAAARRRTRRGRAGAARAARFRGSRARAPLRARARAGGRAAPRRAAPGARPPRAGGRRGSRGSGACRARRGRGAASR